jgi:hypothetical protein
MGIQIQGNSGTIQEVAGATFKAAHVHLKPLEYGALGHYRTSVVVTMATSQAANSRLFEIRNTHATNLIIPTRIRVGMMPTGTVTNPYAHQIGLFRLTNFTAVDTTNTVTPASSVRRASMAAYPGGAAVRHVTLAGAAAGMTGGTMTKDAQAAANFINWASTAAATTQSIYQELLEDVQGTHPFVFAQNEGFEIENVVGGSATANVIQVVIDVSWAEVTAY